MCGIRGCCAACVLCVVGLSVRFWFARAGSVWFHKIQHGLALFCKVLTCFDVFVRAFRDFTGIDGSSPKAGAKGLPCGIVRAIGRLEPSRLACMCVYM